MNQSGIPYIYWVAWWIIALAIYLGLFLWWKNEIKKTDKKNKERFNLIQEQREKKLTDLNR